ncbi:probable disease resistance protein At4g27220 [Prosopis cineraria]|uniref:probable disease resistance protein At4g27220 n=1 Tax=Prosopis cineraria TaxID=364024 RepID=UPI00240FD4D3|nr:probable disease resistance protein At4g27220 [Prosopis cineraria]
MACQDFGVNLGAGVVANLATTVVRQARYCYKFNKIVEDLEGEQNNLRSTKESMQVQVRKARANTHEPTEVTQEKLKKVEDLLEEAKKLKGKAEASKSCCNAVLPNWICRYIVGKKVAGVAEEMKQLNENLGQMLLPVHRESLRPMRASEELIFVSREEVLQKLLMALKDDEKTKIGLYGMGGCGKTFLLNEVQKSVKDLELFDKIVFVRVSKRQKTAIQQDIASWLGLIFETEIGEDTRANRLSMGFTEDNKYLIILDDVWEVLQCDKIGIPLGENCKVLLSTRGQNLCTMMNCQEAIHLSLLTKEEAWDLFQRHAGEIADSDVAQEIADMCHRLPIAIKVVASILKDQPLNVWKDTLATLKDHRQPLCIEDGLEDFYKCLELSVNHLKDQEKSLLLLCAFLAKDSKISLEDLIKFAFGLDIFDDVDSYSRAREKVDIAIDKIKKRSSLLQVEGQIVEMHDLVRDVALLVADKKTRVITGPGHNLMAFIEKDDWEDTRRLSCRDVNEFPNQLNCPNLEILFISAGGGCYSELPTTFFKETIKLKVLVIVNTFIWRSPNLLLPQSVDELRKLRTLCLRGWKLNNISILGKLNMLDTVQLLNCVVQELPNELAGLRKLKFLEVSGSRIGGNPFEVLARCCHLEELYFIENNVSEMVSNDQIVVELFHQIGHSKNLKRYHLEIGRCIDTLKDDSTSKFIYINDFNVSSANVEAIQNLAQKLEVLFLEKIRGDYKSLIPEVIPLEGECKIELTEILLFDFNIECLIDTTNQLYEESILFPKLMKLKLEAMNSLEALCRGPTPPGLFKNLKELIIIQCGRLVSIGQLKLFQLKAIQLEDCPELIFLFTTATAQKMEMLEVLKVKECDKLKHIIEDGREDDIVSTIEPVFPKIKQVCINGCEHLECILPALFASRLAQLESLEIEEARELKYVFGKCNHECQHQRQSIELPHLRVMKLIHLPNITSICPQDYDVTCPSLDKQHVMGCPRWRGMSEARQQGDGKATKQDESLLVLGDEDLGTNVQDGVEKNFILEAFQCFFRFNTLLQISEERRTC